MRRQRVLQVVAIGALFAGAVHCRAPAPATGGATGAASAPAAVAPNPGASATAARETAPLSSTALHSRSAGGGSMAGPQAAELPPAPRFTSKIYAVKIDPAIRTRMKVAKAVTGDQSDAQMPQSFPFQAKANHCYRVSAQAGAGLQDFTLALRDSAGAAIDVHAETAGGAGGADKRARGVADLPEGGAVCFRADDAASVVFSAGAGAGPFMVQIWGD